MTTLKCNEMPEATFIKRIYAPESGAGLKFELNSPSLKSVDCRTDGKNRYFVLKTQFSYSLQKDFLIAQATKPFVEFDLQENGQFSVFIGKMADPYDRDLTHAWTLFLDHSTHGILVERISLFHKPTKLGYRYVGENSFLVIVERYKNFDGDG